MDAKLVGVRLEKDFVIESARVPTPNATGSRQSTGYIARASDGRHEQCTRKTGTQTKFCFKDGAVNSGRVHLPGRNHLQCHLMRQL
jgi:hypothetical protein